MKLLSKRNSIVLVAAVVLVAALAWFGSASRTSSVTDAQSKSATSANKKATHVTYEVVTVNSMDQRIYATGTLMANEEVELRSEISGRITSINFSEGAVVQKGSLLVKINDADLRATLKKLELQAELARKAEARAK